MENHRLLEINSVCGIRSTGSIVADIAKDYDAKGWEVKIGYGRGIILGENKKFAVRIGNKIDILINTLSARILDNEGFNAKRQTKKFLAWATEFNPNVLWLHNLHGYYINVEMLFHWIKSRNNMTVYWTLHDCWAFTGHCSYFTYNKCTRWMVGCGNCRFYSNYPKAFIDNSGDNYCRKRDAFLGVNNMTIITPSKWLRDLVNNSFLCGYNVEVVPNKVDLTIFRKSRSNFREVHNLKDKIIVLGVASYWSESKGLKDFERLAEMLDDRYKVVLIGVTPKQKRRLSPKILTIPRTNTKEDLARMYSAADVFLNPSKQETFGMTTLEALACGTKTVVMRNTACEEVADANGGVVVEDDINEIIETIKRLTK